MFSAEDSISGPLYKVLDEGFSLEDLRGLCFELQIDFDNLRGEDKQGKARELVLHCKRRGKLRVLADKVREMRPSLARQVAAALPAGPPWRYWAWYAQMGLWVAVLVVVAVAGFVVNNAWQNRLDTDPQQASETLILVAAFRGPSNASLLPEQAVADALEALKPMVPALNMRVQLVPTRVIATTKEAEAWGKRHRASLVVWGYDDASVVKVNWVNPNQMAPQGVGVAPPLTDMTAITQLHFALTDRVGVAGQVALGWLLFVQNKNREAMAVWALAIVEIRTKALAQQQGMQYDNLLILHGIAASNLGQFEVSMADYEEAARINPRNLLATYNLAVLALNTEKYDVAEVALATIVERGANDPARMFGSALSLLAQVKQKQGWLEEAIQLAERAVAVEPNLVEAWESLSDLYLNQKQWAKAAKAAQNATAIPTVSAWGYFNLGRAQLHLGQMAEAERAYRTGLKHLNLDSADDKDTLKMVVEELQSDQKDFPELEPAIQSVLGLLKAK